MTIISDEMIMAYVDGELDEQQRAVVEQALQQDPVLRKQADMFRETTAMLQGVYDAPLHEEIPAHLMTTITGRPKKKNPAARWLDWWRARPLFPVRAPSLAALVLVVVLLSTLYVGKKKDTSRYPAVVRSQDFMRQLTHIPSGQSFTVTGFEGQVIPVLSFRDQEYSYCRVFDLLNSTQTSAPVQGRGIACHVSAENWQTIVYEPGSSSKRENKKHGTYELATSNDPIEQVVEKRRIGPALNMAGELAAIQRGWE